MNTLEKKLKVYLSVSKQCNIDSLRKTRDFLNKYNIELSEFAGGQYSSEFLDSADVVIFLPNLLPKAYTYHVFLSRGQYTELEKSHSEGKNTLIVSILSDNLYLGTPKSFEIFNSNDWKMDYGRVRISEDIGLLESFVPMLPSINTPLLEKTTIFKLHLSTYKKLK